MSVSNSYSPVSVLQLHRESHINDVIVICSAVIFAGVVVVGLADVLRGEGEIVEKLDIEAGVQAGLLEPGKAVLGEVAPVWFVCDMH